MMATLSMRLWASVSSMRGQSTPRWQVSRPIFVVMGDYQLIGCIDQIADEIEADLQARFM